MSEANKSEIILSLEIQEELYRQAEDRANSTGETIDEAIDGMIADGLKYRAELSRLKTLFDIDSAKPRVQNLYYPRNDKPLLPPLLPNQREYIRLRDFYTCRYCGAISKGLSIDHVIPGCQGGTSEESNLVAACRHCNSKKNGRTPEQAGMKPPPR
jgi:hypothetical protein